MIRTLIASSILFLMSCTPPRTLYISNKTGKAVTLIVEADSTKKASYQIASFRDSINARRIDPGHIILNFGAGKWRTADKEDLKAVLSKTKVLTGSSNGTHPLPHTKIKHYGWLVNELVFRIYKPK